MKKDNEFSFEIVENIAILGNNDKLMKMFGKVSWNSKKPSYEIRTWKKLENDEVKPYKGIALDIDELKVLKEALNEMDLDEIVKVSE